MTAWFWRRLERRLETLITNRIVTFYAALVDRGQIPPASPGFGITVSRSDTHCSRLAHVRSCSELGDPSPRSSDQLQ